MTHPSYYQPSIATACPLIDILTPEQAHRFAAEERVTAASMRLLADRLEARARGMRDRATGHDLNAARWDDAARGEWGA